MYSILTTACGGRNLKNELSMALFHELPIYRDTMKLLSLTIEKAKCYPRFYRYTVGEKMVNINLDMLSLIYRANSNDENKHDDITSN